MRSWWMTLASMVEKRRVTNFWFCIIVLSALVTCTTAVDTISANQTIRDVPDGETIVSAQETFELGFFSPANSTNRYVGIWYKRISSGKVIWVANRNTPLTNTSGELSLTLQGTLVIRSATGDLIWSSKNSSVRNPVAHLLDTGNFIIRDVDDLENRNPVWQSFDFPTNTFLPGMKFGKDLVTGVERNFTSWKSDGDPSEGNFTVSIYTQGYPQLTLWKNSGIVFRAGPWNGVRFSGEPNLKPNPIYRFGFVLDEKEMYYHYELINTSVITKLIVTPTGSVERLLWIERTQEWFLYLTPQTDNCDRFNLCGPFGSCNIDNSPACGCLEGFEPVSPGQWAVADFSQGCRRKTRLECGAEEGFKRYSDVKLPDTRWSRFNQSMNLDECEKVCKKNCSCSAYATQNISGSGSGCLLWFGDLIDNRVYTVNGQDIYIRMPKSELGEINGKSSSVKRRVEISVLVISILLLIILVSVCVFYGLKRRKKPIQEIQEEDHGHDHENNENSQDDLELPLIDFSILDKATDNFSDNNKLGEGGYGPVYKGVLEGGQEVAVKRLSRTSTQGLDEFKNEVICISKLQHRNLVKLLGCCIKGADKMLVYEYMSNKGLDSFIFDGTKSKKLDWATRFEIIKGIARGLVYLHQDSRLRIIHRDLKVSNILLDHEMIPKISDFGMARSFGGNEIQANTNRVVGTYGYMAPEYAGDGIFSIKSDVFSFGVVMLEIVSGKKNRGFFHKEYTHNLIGHAWGLHKEGKSLGTG
ncbi:unnamed protein product [Lactuca virosa]|uniref:Receptor-like serine/threonine-protein kinase n=1 Tax=Lactuca virosa TaxID=75947 RepID=A0AAU9P322_9ASTR|nr:unnamed protein product [Lactuca virosa]